VLSEVREAVWYQARAETLQESWMPLVERLVELYAELERNDAAMSMASGGSTDASRDAAGELSRHMRLRLQEILGRGGVTILSDAIAGFDRTRHDLARGIPPPPDGTPITRFLSPAFLVDGRVLRRARVEVAESLPTPTKAIDSKVTEQAAAPFSTDTPDLPHDDEEGDTLEVPPLSE
jgi:sirohydrochlorin ferrochelatase